MPLPPSKNAATKNTLTSTVHKQLTALLPHGLNRLAVAVSGGPDSMALCLLAKAWCEQQTIHLTALVVDHSMRPESAQEAAHVTTWLHTRQIHSVTLTNDTPPPASNLQAWARDIRYRLMGDYCAQQKVHHLLLGHHADDQAETILMRYQRGAGPVGLTGMQPSATRGNLTLIRPLLDTPKSELVTYLETQKQPYLTDPSNASDRYTRNRLRKQLNAHPELRGRLVQLAKQLRPIAAQQEREVTHFINNAVSHDVWGFARITLPALTAADPTIYTLALMRTLSSVSQKQTAPRFRETQAMTQRMAQQPRLTFHGCVLERKGSTWFIYPELHQLTHTPWNAEDGTPLTLAPLGEAGYRHIKPSVALRRDIPRRIYRTLPAVFDAKDLEIPLHVPHIDYWDPAWKQRSIA